MSWALQRVFVSCFPGGKVGKVLKFFSVSPEPQEKNTYTQILSKTDLNPLRSGLWFPLQTHLSDSSYTELFKKTSQVPFFWITLTFLTYHVTYILFSITNVSCDNWNTLKASVAYTKSPMWAWLPSSILFSHHLEHRPPRNPHKGRKEEKGAPWCRTHCSQSKVELGTQFKLTFRKAGGWQGLMLNLRLCFV